MIGQGEAVKRLREEAERVEYIRFCLGAYINSCIDCPTETLCLGLYLKEKKDHEEIP
jgi:hypothetical protein